MTHSDTVINSNRVELFGNAPGLDNRIRNKFAHVAQVNVTWNELGEGVDDSNDRLTKVIVTHTRCTPQGASASHVAAGCGSCRTERPWHGFLLSEDDRGPHTLYRHQAGRQTFLAISIGRCRLFGL